MTTKTPTLQNLNLQDLLTERQIIEQGFLSWEDVMQWQEYKPHLIKALADHVGDDVSEFVETMRGGYKILYPRVKMAILDYEIKMLKEMIK